MTRPVLDGVRVLDFTWVWSGPMVGAALADLGAEVIKVEHRDRLDNSRLRGRPIRDGEPVPGPPEETSPYFHQNNRGKLSLALNIKSPAGLELAVRLVKNSDVILDNFTPGTLERLGLGYRAVSGVNRRIIMLSMSAAGATGPRTALRGYAPIMTALSGLESLVGYEGEGILGMPTYGIGDPNAASHALAAVLAALVRRERFGGGMFIDLSQTDAMVGTLGEAIAAYQLTGDTGIGKGLQHHGFAPYGNFPCRGDDHWIAIAVADDAEWARLRSVLGDPALDNEEFATDAGRRSERRRLDGLVSAATATFERDDLFRQLAEADVMAAPVLDIVDVLANEQFRARGSFRTVEHSVTGPELLAALPWRMGDLSPAIRASAPTVGEHTHDILTRVLGMDGAEIRAYETAGALR